MIKGSQDFGMQVCLHYLVCFVMRCSLVPFAEAEEPAHVVARTELNSQEMAKLLMFKSGFDMDLFSFQEAGATTAFRS